MIASGNPLMVRVVHHLYCKQTLLSSVLRTESNFCRQGGVYLEFCSEFPPIFGASHCGASAINRLSSAKRGFTRDISSSTIPFSHRTSQDILQIINEFLTCSTGCMFADLCVSLMPHDTISTACKCRHLGDMPPAGRNGDDSQTEHIGHRRVCSPDGRRSTMPFWSMLRMCHSCWIPAGAMQQVFC